MFFKCKSDQISNFKIFRLNRRELSRELETLSSLIESISLLTSEPI